MNSTSQINLSQLRLITVAADYDCDAINRATTLAFFAHNGYTRENGTARMLRPLAVQRWLAWAGYENQGLHATALLYEAIRFNAGERGQQLRAEIKQTLGYEVLALVDCMAQDPPAGLPRSKRDAWQLRHLRQAPWEVQVITLAEAVACADEGPDPTMSDLEVFSHVQHVNDMDKQVLESAFPVPALRTFCLRLVGIFFDEIQKQIWPASITGVPWLQDCLAHFVNRADHPK